MQNDAAAAGLSPRWPAYSRWATFRLPPGPRTCLWAESRCRPTAHAHARAMRYAPTGQAGSPIMGRAEAALAVGHVGRGVLFFFQGISEDFLI